MVSALRPIWEVVLTPCEFLHTDAGLEQVADAIISLDEKAKVVMGATGRYHGLVIVLQNNLISLTETACTAYRRRHLLNATGSGANEKAINNL